MLKRGSIAIFAAWLALIGASVAIIARTGLTTDLQAFLPAAPTPAQQVLVDQLRDGFVSRLILIAIEGSEPSTLARLSRNMVSRLADDPAFVYVDNGSEDRLAATRAFLMEHRYLLSPKMTEGHFSAQNLHSELQTQLQLLASSMGMLTGALLKSDPTGEFLAIVERLESGHRPATRDGVWFNETGTRALLMAQTSSPGYDIDSQERALEQIGDAFREARETLGDAQAKLIDVGPGVFAVQIRNAIKSDAIRITTAAALAIAALLLFVMRSPRALVLILVPVTSGALAGIAAVALWFGNVHGITIGFGATLIGESVDYAIYLLAGATRGQRPEATLARIWPTLRLGVLTSVVGTAALLFSGFPGLAQLALFSICGLIVALAVTRWIVPRLMPQNFSVAWLQHWESALARLVPRLPVARLPMIMVVLACLAWLFYQGETPWRDDFESLNPVPVAEKHLDQELRKELGAPDVRKLVVVRGVDQESTLQIAESVGRVLDKQTGEGVLGGYDSPAIYLPSQKIQRARQEAIPDQQVLRTNLAKALTGLPFKPGVFDAFIRQTQAAKRAPVLTQHDLESTPLATRVDSLLVAHRGGWYAMLPLLDVSQPDTLAAALAGFDPQQVMLLDLKAETDALYQGYRVRILTFATIGAFAIFVLLLAVLHSMRRALAVVMPVVAAIIVSVAILTATGAALNMFHLVAMLLVIGVGTNYTLFFDRAVQHESHSGRIYVSLLTCNLSTVMGFGVIALASTPILAAIGSTVAIGAALSLLFGAVFMHRYVPDGAASAPDPESAPENQR